MVVADPDPRNRRTLRAADPGSALDRFGTYIAAAELDLPGGPVFAASVHARAQSVGPDWLEGLDPDLIRRADVPDVWQNDLAYHLLRLRAGQRPLILAGDWNTCRAYDPPHPTYRGGREFFSRIQRDGLIDACHMDDGPEAPTRGEYALDHVVVSPTFVPVSVEIETTATPTFSDHAPVVIDLAVS